MHRQFCSADAKHLNRCNILKRIKGFEYDNSVTRSLDVRCIDLHIKKALKKKTKCVPDGVQLGRSQETGLDSAANDAGGVAGIDHFFC